ncbi:hypothetical protein [Burkholderia vietnamiensis]|uniref:hypothetical protein n=1 Tax=Burkholderia vietnamiensis TaxID=60552 RepID=UPI001B96CFC8|nr:hypothetical protein [Burkholderia vietnamiensis]MBR8150491.1 hypothetical protein [Burkholderia vietnamiensis]
MDFIYNNEKISTQDDIKISVADLRDLIQAHELKGGQALAEYQLIVDAILRKNRLPAGTILIGLDN